MQNRRVLHHSDKIRLQKSTDLRGLLFAANILKLAELRDTLWVPSGFSREGPDEPANAVFFGLPWAIFLRFPGASPGRYEHDSGMGFTSGQTPHLLVRSILRRKRHLATENGRTLCYYTGNRQFMRIAFQDLILHSYCFFPRFPHLLSRNQVLDWRRILWQKAATL